MENYRIVIGVDEAGYGPNIGPLLIAASVWRIPHQFNELEIAEKLAGCFRSYPWSAGCHHVPFGDSKQLYSSAHGLRTLEAGLMSMLSLLPQAPPCQCLSDLLAALDLEANCWLAEPPTLRPAWYAQLTAPVPDQVSRDEVARLGKIAQTALDHCDIQLLAIKSLVVIEPRFNQLVETLGSKGRLLSTLTMRLVTELLVQHADQPIEVFCDRQGGRKKYACVLLEAMPDDWFATLAEQPARSSYRRQRQPELKIHFSVGGDSFPPTALASMAAKYLRERLMASLNHYWQSHLPDLVPTAGYPQDAKRFRQQIEPTAMQLGLDSNQWWRIC